MALQNLSTAEPMALAASCTGLPAALSLPIFCAAVATALASFFSAKTLLRHWRSRVAKASSSSSAVLAALTQPGSNGAQATAPCFFCSALSRSDTSFLSGRLPFFFSQ